MKPLFSIALTMLAWAASVNAQQQWQELNLSVNPPARSGHTLTEIAGTLYLFGGATGSSLPNQDTDNLPGLKGITAEADNDLWRWNNGQGTWDEINTSTPPAPRAYHAATSAGGKLYILGGIDANNLPLKEVWSYDPNANSWLQNPYSTSLPPKYEASIAGANVSTIYLFGGYQSPGVLTGSGLWQYNPINGNISTLSNNPEGSRVGHYTIWYNNKLYIFGGFGANSAEVPWVQTYEPNEYMWEEPTPTSMPPSKRAYSACTSYGTEVYVFGGQDASGNELKDGWKYNLADNKWTQLPDMPRPLTQAKAAAAGTGTGADIIVFGGISGGVVQNKTILFGEPRTTGQWTVVNPGVKPPARTGHTMTEIDGNLYVFGGTGKGITGSAVVNDLWKWDNGAGVWSPLKPSNPLPAPRTEQAATKAGSNLYVQGGKTATGSTNDLWKFLPGGNGVWEQILAHTDPPGSTALPLVYGAGMAGDDAGNALYLFGGKQGETVPGDDKVRKISTAGGPVSGFYNNPEGPRNGHHLEWVNNKLYIFGGIGAYSAVPWVQVFDPATDQWESPAPNSPEPPARIDATYCLSGNLMYVFGGKDGSSQANLKDAWSYNLTTQVWKQLPDMPLPLTKAAAAALAVSGGGVLKSAASGSATGDQIIVFGGISNGDIQDLMLKYTPDAGSDCVNPGSGGTIATDQTGSNPFDPAIITNTTAPTGHSGILEYKWQSSTTGNSSGFTDIALINVASYDPDTLTVSTWYKRLSRVVCMSDWTGAAESNVVEIKVDTASTVKVTRELPAGWSWFSLNVENMDMALVQVLKSMVLTDGDYIKNQTVSATYYKDFGWFGELTQIDPRETYKIRLGVADTLIYEGIRVDPLSRPITLNAGWNWIGYLPQTEQVVNSALASISPVAGDYIKNQTASATFYDGVGWFGELVNMIPLEGYMLKTSFAGTLVFSAAGSLKMKSLPGR